MGFGGGGEGDEGIEFGAGFAGVEGFSGEGDAFGEIGGSAGGDESGGSVGEENVAAGAVFAEEKRAAKKFVNDFRVVGGIAAGEGFDGRAAKSEVFRSDGVGVDLAVAQFGYGRFAGDGNFIEAVGAVDDEGAAGAEFAECAGDAFDIGGVENAYDLRGCAGGIG